MTLAEILTRNKIPIVDEWERKHKLFAIKCDEGFIVWNFNKGFAIYIGKPEQLKHVW